MNGYICKIPRFGWNNPHIVVVQPLRTSSQPRYVSSIGTEWENCSDEEEILRGSNSEIKDGAAKAGWLWNQLEPVKSTPKMIWFNQ